MFSTARNIRRIAQLNEVGRIAWFAKSNIPAGWMECDFSAISRTTYAELFAEIGTTYGVGDGSTTFNIPDCRDRVAISKSAGGLGSDRPTARTLAGNGGFEVVTLTRAQLPNPLTTSCQVDGGVPAGGNNSYQLSGAAGTAGGSIGNTGGGNAHENMPPFIVFVACICYSSLYLRTLNITSWGNITGLIVNQSDLLSEIKNASAFQLHPMGCDFPTSSFPQIDTRNAQTCLDYDASADEDAIWRCRPMRAYKGGSLTLNLLCAMSSATTGNVVMRASIERNRPGTDNMSSDSFATAVSSSAIAVPGTNGVLFNVPINIDNTQNDSLSATDPFRIKIGRFASTGTDTASGDLELYLAEIIQA